MDRVEWANGLALIDEHFDLSYKIADELKNFGRNLRASANLRAY
jgi:hypothetical protein